MAVAQKSDLPIDGFTTKNQAAYIALAKNYRKKHGSFKGFKEKYGFGYWPNKDGNFTVYEPVMRSGSVGVKSHYGRLNQKQKDRIKRDDAALQQLFGEDTFPAPEPGKQVHHKRKISQYAPFFEGATLEEARELARYAAEDLGQPLSNVLENAEQLSPKVHTQHHNWERKQGYTQPGFADMAKDGPLPTNYNGADLETRKYGLNRFIKNEQPRIDQNLADLKSVERGLGKEPVKFLSDNGAIRLAKGAIRNPLVRAGLIGGGLSLSALNAGMVRAETEGDDSLLANTRRGLADAEVALDGATIAAGATGVGLPVAAATELASTAVGLTAMGVDAFVTNAEKADEAVKRGGRFTVGAGPISLTFPELGISERLGFN